MKKEYKYNWDTGDWELTDRYIKYIRGQANQSPLDRAIMDGWLKSYTNERKEREELEGFKRRVSAEIAAMKARQSYCDEVYNRHLYESLNESTGSFSFNIFSKIFR